MNFPEYDGGCVVNLVNSIVKAKGGEPVNPELTVLPSEQIKEKNVVLLVIDGMGYEYLRRHPDSFLWKNTKERMTSVFPTSTPCAMTGIFSGLTPQQHGIPEWYTYLEEVGEVTIPLPFETRITETPLDELGMEPKELYDFETIFERMAVPSFALQQDYLADTETSKCFLRGAERIGCDDLKDILDKVVELTEREGEKFITAYWSKLDTHTHAHGTKHKKVEKHFQEIDKLVKEFAEKLENTLLLITADHGLADIEEENTVIVNDFPEAMKELKHPLTGGSRTAFAFLNGDEAFKKMLEGKAELHEPKELLEKGYFGTGEVHPKFLKRMGDLAVLMKEEYAIKDFVEGEEFDLHKGRHGGLSDQELFVPLIIIQSD